MALLVGCVRIMLSPCACIRVLEREGESGWPVRLMHKYTACSLAHGLVNEENAYVDKCKGLSVTESLNIITHAHASTHTQTHTKQQTEQGACAGTPGEFRQHVSISQQEVPIKTAMLTSPPAPPPPGLYSVTLLPHLPIHAYIPPRMNTDISLHHTWVQKDSAFFFFCWVALFRSTRGWVSGSAGYFYTVHAPVCVLVCAHVCILFSSIPGYPHCWTSL